MITLKSINEFIANKNIAIAGASRNPKKFGNIITQNLLKKGFNVFPVNPNATEILGRKCYSDISSLPQKVSAIVFVTKPEVTEKLVPEVIQKGITQLWLQQGSHNVKAIELAQNNKANVIYNHCILMFLKPTQWIHNVHRFFKNITGTCPK
jgi:uncharacterized protein